MREEYFAHCDALAAKIRPVASEERVVPTSHGSTFVSITGPPGAPPLVLLPGAGATSLMWAQNIRALSAEYRTVAAGRINEMGRSSCTQPVRPLGDIMDWLNELCDALELHNGINMAGLSYGGALTAQYALGFPERLRKAVLLAPRATVLRLSAAFAVRPIMAAIAARRCMPSLFRWMFVDLARKDPGWLDATFEELFLNMRILQRRKIPFPPVVSDAGWGSLKVPALFLAGEHEVIYSAKELLRRLNRVAPMIKSEVISGAGHDPTLVQAGSVNRLILEFLRNWLRALRATPALWNRDRPGSRKCATLLAGLQSRPAGQRLSFESIPQPARPLAPREVLPVQAAPAGLSDGPPPSLSE